jgi:hypothetical protein
MRSSAPPSGPSELAQPLHLVPGISDRAREEAERRTVGQARVAAEDRLEPPQRGLVTVA